MNLFIDSISDPWSLILFSNERKIIVKKSINVALNESSKLVKLIDEIIKESDLKYKDIKNIVVINWPWSFTWVRTSVLIANTIWFVNKWHLTAINFFELFDNYPILKKSSKRDYFLKKDQNSDIEVIKNENFLKYIEEKKIKKIYWDFENLNNLSIIVSNEVNYEKIIRNIKLEKNKIISAFYLKKPNIC